MIPAAVLMIAGYAADAFGGAIAPLPMAFVAIVALVVTVRTVRGRADAAGDAGERLAGVLTGAIVAVTLAYFLWLASPSLLPVTNGPDVVHHLVLIHLIQQTHHLVHGAGLNAYLLEMAAYTPGSHILAALVAAWTRVDAVRVVDPIAAACTSVSLAIVYVLAFRALGGDRTAAYQACAAPVLALAPAAYTLGGFMHFFYFAQIVAGTCALTVLLAATASPFIGRRASLGWSSLAAAGVVLAWPVWIVPPILTMAAMAVVRRDRSVAIRGVVLALLPAAVIFAAHMAGHRGAERIATASGAVVAPSIATFGAGFTECALSGAAAALLTRQGLAVLAFAAAVLLEAAGLTALNRAAGSGSVYLPFKMMFLLVPPAAALGAFALGRASQAAVTRLPRLRWIAAAVPALVAALVLSGRVPVRRQHGSITDQALAAGEWARNQLPSACVDYFSSYWLTGYWLHLDVLGNPRESDRMRTETFEFRDTVGKWIEGRGLPYAFVEDFDAVPKDARDDMVPVARFGRAAIVRNVRPPACVDKSPSLWNLARER